MKNAELPLSAPPSSGSMNVTGGAEVTVATLGQFLLGSRLAILTLASRRDTFWLGLMLVISAGFVREYDRSDLLQKPWLVLVPFCATIGISLVLFPVVNVIARQRGATDGRYWERFHVFVSLLWMTAPLAWVFVLPVERMMSPDSAVIINMWLLGVITVWRIILISRILAVLFVPRANDIVFTGTFLAVMLVVDTLSLCNFGGDRLIMMVGDHSHAPVAGFFMIQVMSIAAIVGVVTWPIWLVGTLAVALWQGTRWSWTVTSVSVPTPISKGVKLLAAASVLIWAVVLPITQPYQPHYVDDVVPAAAETASKQPVRH